MTDKEYIEREALLKEVKAICGCFSTPLIIRAIENAKVEDVEKVVRCKDCVCCDICYPAKEIGNEALIGYFCTVIRDYRQPTDFCSYGKKKAGAEE